MSGLLIGYPTPYGRGSGLRAIFGGWSAEGHVHEMHLYNPALRGGIILLLVDVLIVFVFSFPANSRGAMSAGPSPVTSEPPARGPECLQARQKNVDEKPLIRDRFLHFTHADACASDDGSRSDFGVVQ